MKVLEVIQFVVGYNGVLLAPEKFDLRNQRVIARDGFGRAVSIDLVEDQTFPCTGLRDEGGNPVALGHILTDPTEEGGPEYTVVATDGEFALSCPDGNGDVAYFPIVDVREMRVAAHAYLRANAPAPLEDVDVNQQDLNAELDANGDPVQPIENPTETPTTDAP